MLGEAPTPTSPTSTGNVGGEPPGFTMIDPELTPTNVAPVRFVPVRFVPVSTYQIGIGQSDAVQVGGVEVCSGADEVATGGQAPVRWEWY